MATLGYGVLLKEGDAASPEQFTAIAELFNLSGPGLALDAVESTFSIADVLADEQATSDQRKEGNSVALWTASNSTLSSVAVGEGFAPQSGTYDMKIVAGGNPAQARQSFTTVVGIKYRIKAWLRDTDYTDGDLTLRVGTAAGGNQEGESAAVTADTTWQERTVEFTAAGTTTHISVSKATATVLNFYADNISAVLAQSTNREFIAGLLDGGEVSAEMNFLPANATQNEAAGILKTMKDRTLRNWQIVWTDAGPTTWSIAAFITAFEPSASIEDRMTASITLKISGDSTLA